MQIRSVVLLALASAMVAFALLFARPHPTPGPPMRDFEAYYAAGTAWQRGVDPYGTRIWESERVLAGVSTERYEMLPFVGPPVTLPIWAALSHLPFSAANLAWRIALVLSATVLLIAVLHLTGAPIRLKTFVTGAIFALGFGPLTSCVALGQIALPACAFAALSLVRPFFVPFAWTQPNVALALASQLRTRKGSLVFGTGAAMFVLSCVAIAGTAGFMHYVNVLHAHARAEQFSAIQLTPEAIAYGFGASERTAAFAGAVAVIAALAAWFALMRVVRDDVARFCGTCALLPIAMPFFHEHDLIVTFIPAAYFALKCTARVWPLVTAGALFCATDWLGFAQRPDGAIQTLLLVGAAALALFALRDDLELPSLVVPAGVLAVIVPAALYAQNHAAPVWPDALQAFHALPTGDAAAIWHAEQIATGLMRTSAFCALLRCGSLVGCVVLAYASLRFCHREESNDHEESRGKQASIPQPSFDEALW